MDKEMKSIMRIVIILGSIMVALIILNVFLLNQFPDDPWTEKTFSQAYLGIQTIILIFTLGVYIKLADISNKTLQFTKTQTAFNSYFDNFKLYNDLSKKNIGIVLNDELYSDQKPFFENMTFENIHINYLKILEKFPLEGKTVEYTIVFNRHNHKVQSFLNTLLRELVNIKEDNDLSGKDRATLIFLYRDFLLYDYINLCSDLTKNKEVNDQSNLGDLPNYLVCNNNGNIVFDIDDFLFLFNWLKKLVILDLTKYN